MTKRTTNAHKNQKFNRKEPEECVEDTETIIYYPINFTIKNSDFLNSNGSFKNCHKETGVQIRTTIMNKKQSVTIFF